MCVCGLDAKSRVSFSALLGLRVCTGGVMMVNVNLCQEFCAVIFSNLAAPLPARPRLKAIRVTAGGTPVQCPNLVGN